MKRRWCNLLYKCAQGSAIGCLQSCFVTVNCNYVLGANPKFGGFKEENSQYETCFFACVALNGWNKLPDSLKQLPVLNSFKKAVAYLLEGTLPMFFKLQR